MPDQKYRAKITEGHNALLAAIEGLPADAFYAPPLFEDSVWTVTDILGHVATWQEVMLDALDCLVAGSEPFILAQARRIGIDTFNAHKVAIHKGRSLQTHLIELGWRYRDVLRSLSLFSLAELETPGYWSWLDEGQSLIDFIAANDWDHKHEHAEEIRAWRRRHGFGDPRADRPEVPNLMEEYSLALVRYESEHRRFMNNVVEALALNPRDAAETEGGERCREMVIYLTAWVEEALQGFECGHLTSLERDREAFRRDVVAAREGVSWADALISLQDAHAHLIAVADALPVETIQSSPCYLEWIDGLSAELMLDRDCVRMCEDAG